MRKINQCLNNQILSICKKSIHIESLNANLLKHLPQNLQTRCQISSFEKGILTFVTDDAVWASQLRYCLSEIRDKLRKEAGLYQLIGTKIIINPVPFSTNKENFQQKAVPLSEEAKANLQQIHNNCKFLPLKALLDKIIHPKINH